MALIAFDITTESDELPQFMEGFKLQSPEDIDRLGYNISWMHYLNGEAVISVTPMKLEARLDFKIMERKTILFSLELHLGNEANEHLTLPVDFNKSLHMKGS